MPSSSFKEAFPAVAGIEVEVSIRRGGPLDERPQHRHYSTENISMEPVRCPNPQCAGGGWRLWEAVREVVERKETTAKRGGVCQGSERMNRTQSRTCLALFQAEISVTYR